MSDLLKLRNDLGLLSEEYDMKAEETGWEFSAGFSHIALVNAAFDLEDGEGVRERTCRQGTALRIAVGPSFGEVAGVCSFIR